MHPNEHIYRLEQRSNSRQYFSNSYSRKPVGATNLVFPQFMCVNRFQDAGKEFPYAKEKRNDTRHNHAIEQREYGKKRSAQPIGKQPMGAMQDASFFVIYQGVGGARKQHRQTQRDSNDRNIIAARKQRKKSPAEQNQPGDGP